MKLPVEYDLYEHNRHLDKLLCIATVLSEALPPMLLNLTPGGLQNICATNLKHIKAISDHLIHLELALKEISKLKDESLCGY